MHAVGERADRPHVGAPVIDVAARNDKLGDHVGRVHEGDQQTKTSSMTNLEVKHLCELMPFMP